MTSISTELEQQVLEIIRKHPEVIAEVLQTYEQQQEQAKQQNYLAFLDTLKNDPNSIIGNSPSAGESDPEVWLIEFSDFQSASCADSHDAIGAFMDRYGDRVQLVYKHFPLTQQYPEAENAAKAAWAADQQGRFWPYHDGLFNQQNELGDRLYWALAEDLGLDLEQFDRDRNMASVSSAIARDTELGNQLGLTGTPFFIMLARGKCETFSGAIAPEKLEEMLEKVSG